jgi:hypothetical protein
MDLNRRDFVASSVGAGLIGSSGCIGGDNGSETETVPFLSLVETSGPLSEMGTVYATAEEALVQYLNEEDVFDFDFEYVSRDFGWKADEAVRIYDEYTQEYDPGFLFGVGASDGLSLSSRVAEDEVTHINPQETPEVASPGLPWSFVSHSIYHDQVRVFLEVVEEDDPGSRVGIIFPDVPGGRGIVKAMSYAEELDIEAGIEIAQPIDASSADSQMERAREDELDYLISHNTTALHVITTQSANKVYPEVTVVGTAGAASEFRVQEAPDIFEDHGFVSSTKTFNEVVEEDTTGSEVLNTTFERYHDSSAADADPELGNINYIQAMNGVDLVKRTLENTIEMDGDPQNGSDVREGVLAIEDYEGWELSPPRTITDDDPRPSTAARVYDVTDGQFEFVSERSVPRREEWIPEGP